MTLTRIHALIAKQDLFIQELKDAIEEMRLERLERKIYEQIRIQRSLFTWNKIWSNTPYADR
jgi:hypothetical protein